MRIIVTGATGHIGNNLVSLLCLNKSFQVVACFRDKNKATIFDSMDISISIGDVQDIEYLKRTFINADVVVHLAGKISIDGDADGTVMRTNIEGVRNVVEACHSCDVRKLIHMSSIHALDIYKEQEVMTEDCSPAGKDHMIYDYSKAMGEQLVVEAIQNGLNAYILYPTGVIGPNDYFESLSGIMMRKMFSGKLPALLEGGFDWVDVRDVVKVIEKIILLSGDENDSVEQRKFILSGHFASLMDLATRASEISKVKPPRFLFKKEMALFFLPFIKFAAKLSGTAPIYTRESIGTLLDGRLKFSHARAREKWNYIPRPLDETIADSYQWYQSAGML